MKKLIQWFDEDTLPSLGIVTYNKDTSKCVDVLLEYHLSDCKWEASHVSAAVSCFQQLLKVPMEEDEVYKALNNYLLRYLHRFVTISDIRNMAAVYAGWRREFKAGISFEPWLGTGTVWAPLFVNTVKHSLRHGSYEVHMTAIAGPASGIPVNRNVDSRAANMLFRELIGYRGGPLDTPPSVLFLGGLYFIALLQMENKRVNITQAFTTPLMRDHNKELMSRREGSCLGGFLVSGNCTPYCPLSRKDCILSTHDDTRIAGTCQNLVVRHTGYIMNSGYCSKCLREGLVNITSDDDML